MAVVECMISFFLLQKKKREIFVYLIRRISGELNPGLRWRWRWRWRGKACDKLMYMSGKTRGQIWRRGKGKG